MPKTSWNTDPKHKYLIWRPITKREGDVVRVCEGIYHRSVVDTMPVSKTDDGELAFPVVVINLLFLHSVYEGKPTGGYATDFEVKPLGKDWLRLTRVGERELAKLKNTMNNLISSYSKDPSNYTIRPYRWNTEHNRAIHLDYEREPLPVPTPAPTPAPTQAPLPTPEPVEEEYVDESVKNCIDDLIESIRDYVSYDSVIEDEGEMRVCALLETLKDLVECRNPTLARFLRDGQGRRGREILGETEDY